MNKIFDPQFTWFFENLEKNNHKEWFDEHKKVYQNAVKKPFNQLVETVITLMQTEDASLMVEPKNCIFRINRDIRFSKDKTPYKTFVSAAIARGGKKEMAVPGLYFQLNHRAIEVYGGVYMPNKTQLEDIRYYIANNLESFKQAYSQPEFVKTWGNIKGEKNKIIAKDLREMAEIEPLIMNKQFYWQAQLPQHYLLEPNLPQTLFNCYRNAKALNTFFTKAIGAWNEK